MRLVLVLAATGLLAAAFVAPAAFGTAALLSPGHLRGTDAAMGALASTPVVLAPQDGNDTAPQEAPTAIVSAFENEYYHNTGGPRTVTITVPPSPTGHWDRVYLLYRQYPSTNVSQQDPWDRLCSASIQGVEVLHCTTPRTDMTLFHDITNYASLLPPGENATVTVNTGTYDQSQYYVGGQYVTAELYFYASHTLGDVPVHAYDRVAPAIEYAYMNADGTPLTTNVSFPAHMDDVTVEVQLSGHGNEEDWFLNDLPPPMFNVTVDGATVGVLQPMPYVYAPAGFYGGDYTEHPLMYWTAQHATNNAGLYTGSGFIPPYRAELPASVVHGLKGTHTVGLVGVNGGSYWVASLTFLVDGAPHDR